MSQPAQQDEKVYGRHPSPFNYGHKYHAEQLRLLADRLVADGKTAEAASLLWASIVLDPQATSLGALGDLLSGLGRLNEALVMEAAAATLSPKNHHGWSKLAEAALACRDFDKAREFAKRAIAILPHFQRMHEFLAVIDAREAEATRDSELQQQKFYDLVWRLAPHVLKQRDEFGQMVELHLDSIPLDSGIYWLTGKTILHDGREYDSVFCVDTHTLFPPDKVRCSECFLRVAGYWHSDVQSVTGISDEQLDYLTTTYRIPIETSSKDD